MKNRIITGMLTSLAMLSASLTSPYTAAAEEMCSNGYVNGGYVHLPEQYNCNSIYEYDESTDPVVGAASFPDAYDLRDEGCVTSIKDQGAEGMCHAFAAIGACETNLLKQGLETDPDSLNLSEAQLGNFLYTLQGDPFDSCYGDYLNAPAKGAAGGNGLFAMAALAGGIGTQLEEYCPYSQWNSGYSEYNRYTGEYRLNKMETITQLSSQTDIDTIKSWLMESGGVGFAFYSRRTLYYDNGTSFSYYAPGKSFRENANHAALIIGWDDNYSRENFAGDELPSSDGAWLVKNSYGPDYFDDGYFWISYEDPTMGSYCRYILEDADNYDDVYEYDGAGYVFGYAYKKAANIFTAEYDCTLTDVSFYIPSGNPASTVYKAEVYLVNDNTNDPTDGMRVSSASLKTSHSGYRKIALENSVDIKEGQQFSVVLSAESSGKNSTTYLAIEESYEITSSFLVETHLDRGESYVLSDENDWLDITDVENNNGVLGNAAIKAFTVRSEEREPVQLKTAIEAAHSSGIDDETLSKAVAEGEAALENNENYRVCSRLAQTILALLEENGNISYPEYIYADYGVICGDSDNDGVVGISDAVMALTAYSAEGAGSIYRLRKSQLIGMDAVQDGSIDMNDAIEILTIYAMHGASA